MDITTVTKPVGTSLSATGPAAGYNALPRLIDVATLAEHLGLTERTIRRKVAQGEIPHYKIGNAIRFDPAEIQAWLETTRVAVQVPVVAGAQNGTRI